ncbi:MAG: DUF6452 family protein [Bacteroidales bacterium]|nr:DUF6452 family protein [Bacteroidales bacterium]
MRSLKHITVALLALIIMLSAFSCSDKACYEEMDPLLYTSLLESGTGDSKKADSVRVIAATPSGQVTLFKQNAVTFFTLPLDPANDLSEFYVIVNGVSDTAVLTYTRRPHLVSAECGYTFLSDLTGLRTTHNIIDTLIIENKSVSLDGEKNLRLFY